MKYYIKPNGNLVITADADEQGLLRTLRDETGNLAGQESETLESLIANSALDWIPEGITGDLTSAPMLGITECDGEGAYLEKLPPKRFGEILVGGDAGGELFTAIIARWAFMDYQVRSFLDDMADTGSCEWQGGFANIQNRAKVQFPRVSRHQQNLKMKYIAKNENGLVNTGWSSIDGLLWSPMEEANPDCIRTFDSAEEAEKFLKEHKIDGGYADTLE